MTLKIKYDYACNACGTVAADLPGEPPGWLHGSVTPYHEDKNVPPSHIEAHLCSWSCAQVFAAEQFKSRPGVRGANLSLFTRDKEKP